MSFNADEIATAFMNENPVDRYANAFLSCIYMAVEKYKRHSEDILS
jgi:hypothetical protein